MPRNPLQEPPGKGRRSGTLPDEDDPLELDRPDVGEQDQQRQGRKRPEENVEQVQVEDEEAEDDEDEADGIGPRPV